MIDLDHPLNKNVVEYIRRGYSAEEREWPRLQAVFRRGEDVPIGELSTHPDLGLLLKDLAAPWGDSVWGVIAGAFVLKNGGGVVVAIASGSSFLAFRTGGKDVLHELSPKLVPELEDWDQVNPWPVNMSESEGFMALRSALSVAMDYATGLVRKDG